MEHNVKNQVTIKFLELKSQMISTEEVGRGLGVWSLGKESIYNALRFLPFHREHLNSTKWIYICVFVYIYSIIMVNDKVIH